jgi:predicted nucleotidyltransferase
VIEDEFDNVPDVASVLIYGSWAARYHGARGAPPADLDVLVVGSPERADVYDAADRAQDRLGMQVNPLIRTPQQWVEATDPLIRQIQSSPTVIVIDTGMDAA